MTPPPTMRRSAAVRLPAPPAWSRELTTVGVTGTNGKTTTTALVASALAQDHAPVPRVTTVGAFLDETRLDVPADYEGFLAALQAGHEGGGRYAAIELTSEALAMGFAKAWPCRVGVFTNLTRDHLDAHGSAEHYLASKAQLFVHLPPGGTAVLNGCDAASELLAEIIPAGVRVLRYGAPNRGSPQGELDLWARSTELSWDGTRVTLELSRSLAPSPGQTITQLQIQSIGQVFAENALAAFAAALALGIAPEVAARGLAAAPRPPGRFEPVAREPSVVVDYAHTPDSLRRTLEAARCLCEGRLWVVFGAGGERDQAKRPQMGNAASIADRIVLTSDNPRSEDPAAIATAVRDGVEATATVWVELDRAVAIREAVRAAGRHDVVVIAGKGHETDQIVGSGRRRFSDRDVVRRAMAEKDDSPAPSG